MRGGSGRLGFAQVQLHRGFPFAGVADAFVGGAPLAQFFFDHIYGLG